VSDELTPPTIDVNHFPTKTTTCVSFTPHSIPISIFLAIYTVFCFNGRMAGPAGHLKQLPPSPSPPFRSYLIKSNQLHKPWSHSQSWPRPPRGRSESHSNSCPGSNVNYDSNGSFDWALIGVLIRVWFEAISFKFSVGAAGYQPVSEFRHQTDTEDYFNEK